MREHAERTFQQPVVMVGKCFVRLMMWRLSGRHANDGPPQTTVYYRENDLAIVVTYVIHINQDRV